MHRSQRLISAAVAAAAAAASAAAASVFSWNGSHCWASRQPEHHQPPPAAASVSAHCSCLRAVVAFADSPSAADRLSPAAATSLSPESEATRQTRRRVSTLLVAARRRLLQRPASGADAAADDVDAILAPVREALAEARTRDRLTDAELHRLSASVHSMVAADCLATGRLRAAERLIRAELQDLLLSGLTVRDPAVLETSVRLGNLLLSNGRVEAGLAGLEFAAQGAAAELADFETRESDSLKLADLLTELGPQTVCDVAEAARLRRLRAELQERRALHGLAQSNLAKALLHFAPAESRNRALDLLRSALDSARLTYPGGHENIACLLNDIGALLSRLGRHDEAVENLEAALRTAEQLPAAPGDLQRQSLLCATLCNLGEVEARRDRPASAARACQRALELARRLPATGDVDKEEDLVGRAHYCMAVVERLLETRGTAG